MNYRKYYKDYFGINFNTEFSVHHIDKNRSNNDIKNLLLLPKKVHARLHFLDNVISSAGGIKLAVYDLATDKYLMSLFENKELMTVFKEIAKWNGIKEIAVYDVRSNHQYGYNWYQKEIDKYIKQKSNE